jgi:hypothetical protein
LYINTSNTNQTKHQNPTNNQQQPDLQTKNPTNKQPPDLQTKNPKSKLPN